MIAYVNFVVTCHVINYTRPSTTLTLKGRPGTEASVKAQVETRLNVTIKRL